MMMQACGMGNDGRGRRPAIPLAHLGARPRLAGCNRRPSARRYPSFLHHTSLPPAERIEAFPVSTLVSSPQQEGRQLVEPVSLEAT